MVWWLNAEPVGNYYPDFEPLDGNRQLIECEDMSDDGGVLPRPGYMSVQAGRRLKTDFVPTKIEWRSRSKVPDIDKPGGLLIVSGRFHEIVECIEPGVHQWLPVEFVDKKGEHLADRYYFIPCNRLDSIDGDISNLILFKDRLWAVPYDLARTNPELLPPDYDPNKKSRYVFMEDHTIVCHAWRDKHLSFDHLLISDELADALQVEKFSGLSLKKAESV